VDLRARRGGDRRVGADGVAALETAGGYALYYVLMRSHDPFHLGLIAAMADALEQL
jgi:hypothetical protein